MSDIVPAGQQSAFDDIRKVDERGEYWLARDLMKILEYSTWQRFDEGPIAKAREDCQKSERDVDENFNNIVKDPTGSGGPGPEPVDYRLTAYACRLIVMAARTRNTDIASKARTYFADKVEQAELLELAKELDDEPLSEVARRIALRMELTEANKELIKRAEAAGIITPEQRAIFMNWGYKGLYAGEVEDDIHARKHLKPSQGISDWMGVMETMANVLRAISAKRRMDRARIKTPGAANRAHYLSGQAVRRFLEAEGIRPEDLPTPTKSYRQIVKDEAERIRQEEELESGLWGQLPPEDKGSL